MALRATIYKVELHVADNDRAYYDTHNLTVARHPSETDERMMVRLLAYALFAQADKTLEFTRGLSEADEPDLWTKDLTGAIGQWIEVGLPDERRLLKACGRSENVKILAYGRNAPLWWRGVENALQRAQNLDVYILNSEGSAALASLVNRKMSLNINIQDSSAWVSNESDVATIQIDKLR